MAPSNPSSRTADTSTPEARRAPRRGGEVDAALAGAQVCVLFGGTSSERDVSVSSGRKVVEALESHAAGDERGPGRVLPVSIDADGRWHVEGDVLDAGEALRSLSGVDVVFNALHGGGGENGELQGFLETGGLTCTGSGVLASALAMDKQLARQILSSSGLRTAAGEVIERAGPQGFQRDRAGVLERLAGWEVQGWVVKPRDGGSSVGVSVVREPAELGAALEAALEFSDEALVETWIDGVEVAAGVLATPDRGLEALPLVEIRPHPGRFFDYEEKYSAQGAEELCPPQAVPSAVCERVQGLALSAHRALRCAGYSRTDFIVPRAGGDPVVLELNTLPGMTPRSLLPRAAGVAGIDYRTLCLWIAGEALARRRLAVR